MANNEPSGEEDEPARPDHTPRVLADAFDCPRCGAYAHQEWQPLQRSLGGGRGLSSLENSAQWLTSRCSRCDDPSVWRGKQMAYPLSRVGPQPHEDMPPHIADLYREAAEVAAVSRRAGAALARATVERLVKHLDTQAEASDNLNTRIGRLQQRVSSNLRTMLHVVRITGNDVLHQEQPGDLAVMALDDEEGPQVLEDLLRTANDLVDELITRQRTVDDLQSKLPSGSRRDWPRAPQQHRDVPEKGGRVNS